MGKNMATIQNVGIQSNNEYVYTILQNNIREEKDELFQLLLRINAIQRKTLNFRKRVEKNCNKDNIEHRRIEVPWKKLIIGREFFCI